MLQEISLSEFNEELPVSAFELFNYPSRTDPRLIAFILRNYTQSETVLDPFAGVGTTSIVATIYGLKSISLDLNPILEIISNVLFDVPALNLTDIINTLKQIDGNSPAPEWAKKWYPDKLFVLNSKLWTFINSQVEPQRSLLALAGFKTSRFFSLCDEKFYKPSQTKYSENKVKKLLTTENLEEVFYNFFLEEVIKTITKIYTLKSYFQTSPKINVKGGIDSIKLDSNFTDDLVIISEPPAFRKHEYIRSCRIELLWFGYTPQQLAELSKYEINGFKMNYNEFIDKISQAIIKIEPKLVALIVSGVTGDTFDIDIKNQYEKRFQAAGYITENVYHVSRNVSRLFRQYKEFEKVAKEKLIVIFKK